MSMNETEKSVEKLSISQVLTSFIFQYRKLLLGLLLGIIVAILASAIGIHISSINAEKNVVVVESLLDELKIVFAKNDQDNEMVEALLKKLKEKSGTTGYVGYRAYTAVAAYYFEQKDWQKAYDAYTVAGNALAKAYTVGISAFNAAVCAENLNKLEEALALYEKAAVVKDFPFKQRAAFNAARLTETVKGLDAAIGAFNKVYEAAPQSDWGKIAKSKVITLQLKK